MQLHTIPSNTAVCSKGLLAFDPVDSCSQAEDAHEGVGGLFVAGGDGAPFLEPGPEPLDLVAMGVDPVWAGYGRLVLLGRDRGPRAQVPDVLAEAMAAVATVGDHPAGYAWQLLEKGHGMRQFVRLPRRQHKGHGSADGIGDHAGFGAKAATRPAKRFTTVSLCWSVAFLAAPAAFWCARMLVPSRKVIPSCTPFS